MWDIHTLLDPLHWPRLSSVAFKWLTRLSTLWLITVPYSNTETVWGRESIGFEANLLVPILVLIINGFVTWDKVHIASLALSFLVIRTVLRIQWKYLKQYVVHNKYLKNVTGYHCYHLMYVFSARVWGTDYICFPLLCSKLSAQLQTWKGAQLVSITWIDESSTTKCYKIYKGPNTVPCKAYTEQILVEPSG